MPQRDGLTESIVQETIRERKAEYELGHYSLALNLSYSSIYDFGVKKCMLLWIHFLEKNSVTSTLKKLVKRWFFQITPKSVTMIHKK